MLTPDQEKEWAKQVEHVQPYVGHRTAGEWAGAIVAVDDELTALRQQVEAQATQIEAFTDALAGASVAVINGRTALEGAREALLKAREALHYYAYPKIEIRDGDAWERIPGDGIAQRVLAAIDAALGKEEALK